MNPYKLLGGALFNISEIKDAIEKDKGNTAGQEKGKSRAEQAGPDVEAIKRLIEQERSISLSSLAEDETDAATDKKETERMDAGMEDSRTGSRPPHSWSVCPDLSWEELTDGQQGAGVFRLTAFPVEKRRILAAEALNRLQKNVKELFSRAIECKSPIIILNAPLRVYITPDSRFFMEDFQRIPLSYHDAFSSWTALNEKDSQCKTAFLQIEGIPKSSWRICFYSEAKLAFQKVSDQDFSPTSHRISGISFKTPEEQVPSWYYVIEGDGVDFSNSYKFYINIL